MIKYITLFCVAFLMTVQAASSKVQVLQETNLHTGTITVTNNATVKNNLLVAGATTVDNITVTNSASIGGTLSVDGGIETGSTDPGSITLNGPSGGTLTLTNDSPAEYRISAPPTGLNGVVHFLFNGTNVSFVVVTNSSGLGYALDMNTNGSLSPSDSTTYYVGVPIFTATTTYTAVRASIPKTGTIKRFYVKVRINGTLGSNENVTHSLSINGGAGVGSTAFTYESSPAEGTDSTINQAVSAGDYIALQIDTPAWVTNPTTVNWYCLVYIE